MNHAVRKVDEEGLFPIPFDEGDGALGVLFGQKFLILVRNLRVDYLVSFDERKMRPALQALVHGQVKDARMIRPHVIGVGESEKFIETMLEREKLAMMPQMPFAYSTCCIPLCLQVIS